MENYGNEIGQKMRSAVKAKLLELGTGGCTAYIDDELPDYVMVMVANKRSKQQMLTDLNLFLGNRTELFVTWLHEVLQKLQEVTLPTAVTSGLSKKKKSSGSSNSAFDSSGKKEKKNSKKDKKAHRKSLDEINATDIEKPTTTTDTMPVSITEVFAEELLEKAKKTLDVSSSMKDEIKKKKHKPSLEQHHIDVQKTSTKDNQTFDIPTISEITSTTGSNGASINIGNIKEIAVITGDREKDLAELAEIQKKIYAAKKHLRKIGEIENNVESEDEDLLKLKNDEQDIVDEPVNKLADKYADTKLPKKVKVPIIFNNRSKTPEIVKEPTNNVKYGPYINKVPTSEKQVQRERQENREPEKRTTNDDRMPARRSVHDRLGLKSTTVTESQPTRKRTEVYVPGYRRNGDDINREREREHERERARDRERNRERERDREGQRQRDLNRRSREREKSLDGQDELTRKTRSLSTGERKQGHSLSREPDEPPVKRRVVSSVFVAPSKFIESSDNENLEEKPVNSVIKIKPRPPVSPRRQACKNLLLRAVADAQRSTILVKTVNPKTIGKDSTSDNSKRKIKSRGISDGNHNITKLYTKSYRERERLKRNIEPSAELFRRSTRSLVVEVKTNSRTLSKRKSSNNSIEDIEEYVPKMVIERDATPNNFDVYVPQTIEQSTDIIEIDGTEQQPEEQQSTQFVVTLHGDKILNNYATKRTTSRLKRSVSPLPQVTSSSSSAIDGSKNIEASSTTGSTERGRRRKTDIRLRLSTKTKFSDRTSNSPSSSNTSPRPVSTRSLKSSDVLHHTKGIQKIVIQNNDTDEEDELSNLKKSELPPKRHTIINKRQRDATNGYDKLPINENRYEKTKIKQNINNNQLDGSMTPPMPPLEKKIKTDMEPMCEADNTDVAVTSTKSKHVPIKFTLKKDSLSSNEDRSENKETEISGRRKISIRNIEDKKYDNIPSLSAVAVDSAVLKVSKPKERCKYHPNCTKQFCDYYHPTATCKSFPNCKFADKCLYSHPKCKYDLACMSVDCNFAHSGPREFSHAQLTAPPLSSHVIPVQNYKSISVTSSTTSTTMCKYYPGCTKVGCSFYHPKPCRYGKNCINKLECAYYHPEMQSSNKFKWVASIV